MKAAKSVFVLISKLPLSNVHREITVTILCRHNILRVPEKNVAFPLFSIPDSEQEGNDGQQYLFASNDQWEELEIDVPQPTTSTKERLNVGLTNSPKMTHDMA